MRKSKLSQLLEDVGLILYDAAVTTLFSILILAFAFFMIEVAFRLMA